MDSSSSRWAVSAAAPTVSAGGILTMAAIFLLFLTFALALIFLHYYYFSTGVAEPEAPAPSGRRQRARGAELAAAPRGVDPELLRSLPVTVYRAASADDVGVVECAVCLAGLEDREEARFLPRCGHGFHAQCVDTWLASHSTCPLCRVTVVSKPDASTSRSTSLPSVPPVPANDRRSGVKDGVGDPARRVQVSGVAEEAVELWEARTVGVDNSALLRRQRQRNSRRRAGH